MSNTYDFQRGSGTRPVGAALITCTILLLSILCVTVGAAVIKPGMSLKIAVKGDAELTQVVKVREDGTIDYPLYQDVPVTDKTTSELQDILTFKLAKVVEAPLVLVSALSESPVVVQVLGHVNKPGPVTTTRRSGLQEVILAAGGLTDQADPSRIKVVCSGADDASAAFYDLQRFLGTGDLGLLPQLSDGDKVIVLGSKRSKYVKVLGAVNKPGFYPLGENASVFDMLYLAGGPAQGADLSRVRVIPAEGASHGDYTLDLQRFVDEGKTEDIPVLSQGDVVILYAKTFTWSRILEGVRDVVTLVTAWILIAQVAK